MSISENQFEWFFNNKRTISKEEFANQVIELVENEHSLALSPEAFELAIGLVYKKYRLGLIERN